MQFLTFEIFLPQNKNHNL